MENVQEILIPVRVFNELGVRVVILTNASGGLNPIYNVGDIVVVSDHIAMVRVLFLPRRRRLSR